MLTKNKIRSLEKKYGFSPQKRLGQNFLIDVNIKQKMLRGSDVTKEDVVIEIGSGLGQLTFDLAKMAKKVIAVEFDKKLFSVLSDSAKDVGNVVLAHEDFLKFNLRDFIPKNRKIKVFSNLPYYISSPVILKLFAYCEYIDRAVLTLQKEVADRLVAFPGSKDYGSLTLFAEYHSEITRLFTVSRNSFYPVPKVDSTVISIKMRESPPVEVNDKEDLFDLIRDGFMMRRKTLVNAALSQKFKGLNREELEKTLMSAGIQVNSRAEELDLQDFARIVNLV